MRLLGPPNIEKLTQKRDIAGLARALGDRDPEVRAAAAEALDELDDPESVGPLLSALRDDEPRVKSHAANTLYHIAVQQPASLADSEALDVLIVCLDDADWAVRSHAADALGAIGDGRAFEPLLSRLADPEDAVRRSAVWALGQLGDARAGEPILELFHEEFNRASQVEDFPSFQWVTIFAGALDRFESSELPEEARAIAAVWCEHWAQAVELGPAALGQLHLMLSQAGYRSGRGKDHGTIWITREGRREAIDPGAVIRTLGDIGDPQSVEPIREYLWDGVASDQDCNAAAEALRKIPGLAAFEVLVSGFRGLAHDNNTWCDEYRSAIASRARDAGASGETNVLAPLLSLFTMKAGPGTQFSGGGENACRELGEQALHAYGAGAADAVRPLLENEDAQIRERATRLLGALEGG